MLHAYKLVCPLSQHAPPQLWEWQQPPFPQTVVPRPWRRETSEALPYPILSGMCRPRLAVLHLAARRSGMQRQLAGRQPPTGVATRYREARQVMTAQAPDQTRPRPRD
jgi:hypothetical protein